MSCCELLHPSDGNAINADGHDLLLQDPYSAAQWWGWVQNGPWSGSTMVHFKSLPEHFVSIDSLHSIIDMVMDAIAAVRHMSATSCNVPEQSANHPPETVEALPPHQGKSQPIVLCSSLPVLTAAAASHTRFSNENFENFENFACLALQQHKRCVQTACGPVAHCRPLSVFLLHAQVAAATTKVHARLVEIMQHKNLPNVVRKSMEDVLMQWLADRKAGRLPPPKPLPPPVTPVAAEGAAAAVELAQGGPRGRTHVRLVGILSTT